MIESIFITFLILITLPLLLISLNIFQLEEYSLKKLFSWIIKNLKTIAKFLIPIFLIKSVVIFYLFFDNIFINFLSLIIFIIFSFSYFFTIYFKWFLLSKTPLKFTKRIDRFIWVYILIFVLSLNIILHIFKFNIIPYFLIFTILFFILFFLMSNLISSFIELIVFSYYRNDAIKKLKQIENLKIVGITGSYGKTTVKNILEKVLNEKYYVCKTPKSFNTPNGIIRTIRENLNSDHQVLICELGANKNHDIKYLTKILENNLKIGIITSVGKQHLDGFKTIDNIYKTKFELAEAVKKNNGIMIFNLNNIYVNKMFREFDGNKLGVYLKDYQDGEKLEFKDIERYKDRVLFGEIIKCTSDGSIFNVVFKGKNLGEFNSNLLGEHNVLNSMLSMAVALILNESTLDILIGLSKVEQIPNRLEVKKLKSGATLIDNGFNSNPVSAEKAVNTLKYFSGCTKIVVTPGLIELASEQFTENYLLGQRIAKVADKTVILNKINKNALTKGLLDTGFKEENIIYFENFNADFIKFLNNLDEKNVVLIENDLPSNYF